MRSIIITILTAFIFFSARGQTSISFYHLGNSVFQNTFNNAAYIPKGKVFFGLPAMSGIHANVNSKLSYNNIFTRTDGITQVDSKKILNSLQKHNMFSTQLDVNLFHLGYTSAKGSSIYVFANERFEADVLVPKSLIQYIVDGNATLVDEKIKISKTRLNTTHFREMGVGYRYYMEDKDLGIGFRLKYLQGFFNASTPQNMTANFTTESENYQLNVELQNAVLRTSGNSIYEGTTGDIGSHLISNGNTGFGLDLGFQSHMGTAYSISGSVNDLGFISWKEDIKNYTLNDTTARYSGLDLKNISDIVQEFKDSVVNKFNTYTTNQDPYNSFLTPRAYFTFGYHPTSQNDIMGTVATRFIQGQWKMLYGIGVNHRIGNYLIASVNAIKVPQQIPNLGAALAFKGGPAQLYIAVDQIAYWSVPDAKSMDVRFGINFIFGKQDKSIKSDTAGKSSFLGDEVEVRGRDGIYTIIERQKKRKVEIEDPH